MRTKGIGRIIAITITMVLVFSMFSTVAFATGNNDTSVKVNFNLTGGPGEIKAKLDGKEIKKNADVEKGKTVEFTATPGDGYQVKEWQLNDKAVPNNTTNSYSLANLQTAAKVTVVVEKKPIADFAVNFSVVNGTGGTLAAKVDGNAITSGTKVQQGKTVQFTAAPQDGYQVKEWKVDGKPVANNTTNSLPLTNLQAAATVTVEFGKKPEANVDFAVAFNVVNGNGTLAAKVDGNAITSGAKVQQGKVVQFAATPQAGYQVKEWKVNGKVVPNNTSKSYTLSNLQAEATVTVEFKKIPDVTFAVTFGVVNGNGSLVAKVDGNAITSGTKVPQGKTVQFTAAPKPGYQVKEWKVDGKVVPNNTSKSYTLTNLQAAAKVTVEYILKKDMVEQTISVKVLWHDNDYGDWKNYRPSYLVFMLEAYDKAGGWTQAISCNAASFGFRWQPNWSFTQTALIPKWYLENSAYTLSGPINAPAGYDFTITGDPGNWTVMAKFNPNAVKANTNANITTTVPLVPKAGF